MNRNQKPQTNDIVLPIIEESKSIAFKIVGWMFITGVISFILVLIFTEFSSMPRIVGMVISLAFVFSPVIIQFFIDRYKKIGIVRITPSELLTKLKGEEPLVFKVENISEINFLVKDFEGEDRTEDMFSKQGRMTLRSGEDNQIAWIHNEKEYHCHFKLDSALQKQRASLYLTELKKTVYQKEKVS